MNTTPTITTEEIEDMLRTSVLDVFSTTLQLEALPSKLTDIRTGEDLLVAGSVGFVGDLSGVCYLYVRADYAKKLASRMLGMPESEIDGNELVDDVIGEISNMVVGAVKSRLFDLGMANKLTIPSIMRGHHLTAHSTSHTECRLQSLECEGEVILLELLIKSTSTPPPTE